MQVSNFIILKSSVTTVIIKQLNNKALIFCECHLPDKLQIVSFEPE